MKMEWQNPGSVVTWVRTHGSDRTPITGVIITSLPKKKAQQRRYTAAVFAEVAHDIILDAHLNNGRMPTGATFDVAYYRGKLAHFFRSTNLDRYLIWVPQIKDFRTPSKSLVDGKADFMASRSNNPIDLPNPYL